MKIISSHQSLSFLKQQGKKLPHAAFQRRGWRKIEFYMCDIVTVAAPQLSKLVFRWNKKCIMHLYAIGCVYNSTANPLWIIITNQSGKRLCLVTVIRGTQRPQNKKWKKRLENIPTIFYFVLSSFELFFSISIFWHFQVEKCIDKCSVCIFCFTLLLLILFLHWRCNNDTFLFRFVFVINFF